MCSDRCNVPLPVIIIISMSVCCLIGLSFILVPGILYLLFDLLIINTSLACLPHKCITQNTCDLSFPNIPIFDYGVFIGTCEQPGLEKQCYIFWSNGQGWWAKSNCDPSIITIVYDVFVFVIVLLLCISCSLRILSMCRKPTSIRQ